MNIEIKKERDTPLLSRKRVTLMAEYEAATPSRASLRAEIAKKLNSPENLVILRHIYTRFGSRKAKIIAHVYRNEEELKKLEDDSLLVKHGYPSTKKKSAEGEKKEEKK